MDILLLKSIVNLFHTVKTKIHSWKLAINYRHLCAQIYNVGKH